MKLVITAGPTREPIDPVRFLSNRSSGKMGYAIAAAALDAGHAVTLISGPVCIEPPRGAQLVRVTTSDEMFDAVMRETRDCDLLVMCAAVADFKPAQRASHKIKKSAGMDHIALIPTRDILAMIGNTEKKFLVVGFAAETDELDANAQKKLREKKCDMIIGNDVSGMDTGMESDHNELKLFFRDGATRVIPRDTKRALAKALMKIFEQLAEKR